MSERITDKCADCFYYVVEPNELTQGRCHLLPPQTVVQPMTTAMGQGIGIASHFPAVQAKNIGCSYFKLCEG